MFGVFYMERKQECCALMSVELRDFLLFTHRRGLQVHNAFWHMPLDLIAAQSEGIR